MAHSNSQSGRQPDLDESINVARAHGAIKDVAPAVGREKRLHENGMEPVSLWLILVSFLVVLIAGAVLGQSGSVFSGYDQLTREGYVRAASPVKEEVPLQPLPMLALLQKEGQKAYSACASCHQPSGLGQAGVFPPLAGSEWVTGSTEKLLLIIHNGVGGPIEVAGTNYNGNMGAIGANLGPKEMAALMTFLRTSWGNDASIVTPEMAAAGLEISKQRGGAKTTASELKKNHDKMLPGDTIDPETLVNPETWEPIGAAQ